MAVTARPTVLVSDTRGRPLAGVSVQFRVGEGQGFVSGEDGTTAYDGRATVGSWTLGPRAGRQTLLATVGGLPAVVFTATAAPGSPSSIALVGNAQVAEVATAVSSVPAVAVTDQFDNPLPGLAVTFAAGNGGSVANGVTTTDSLGVARAGMWTLGTAAGVQCLVATVTGRTVTLVATALPGSPRTLVSLGPATQVAARGTRVRVAPVVRVDDAFGNPVPGAVVTFRIERGLGRIERASAVADAAGHAAAGGLTVGGGADTTIMRAASGAQATFEFRGVGVDFGHASRLAARGAGTCGLTPEMLAFCWGANPYGEVGDGSRGDALAPVPIADGWQFLDLAGTNESACGVLSDGGLACWGQNDFGELGFVGRGRLTPTRLPGTTGFVGIVGGPGYCALSQAGVVSCWGDFSASAPQPIFTPLRFTRIFAGRQHVCGLEPAGEAWCWTTLGFQHAELYVGDGTNRLQTTPTRAGGGGRFRTLALGGVHGCGIALDGEAWCWGANFGGQLGDGTASTRVTPVRVLAPEPFVSIAAGYAFTCAIGVSGSTWCWGAGPAGELGIGSTRPVRVATSERFVELVAGAGHTCGRNAGGRLWCWGSNPAGALGTGTRTSEPSPRPVVQP